MVFVPRDGHGGIGALIKKPVAFFSRRHAADFTGLGTFGVNNMLLTAAPLPPDPVMTEEVCTRCMRCVEMCPAGALDREDYPEGLTDRGACARNSAELEKRRLAQCGICIKV